MIRDAANAIRSQRPLYDAFKKKHHLTICTKTRGAIPSPDMAGVIIARPPHQASVNLTTWTNIGQHLRHQHFQSHLHFAPFSKARTKNSIASTTPLTSFRFPDRSRNGF